MKKMLACLLAAALITASMSGCVNSVRKETIDELGSSYQADEYYEDQQKEIDDIIAEYTEKINNSSNEDEIQNLKDECIEKINAVDKKEMASAKANAKEFFDSVSGTILPYQTSIDYVKALKDSYDTAETPDEINAAIDELKAIVDSCSDSIIINCNFGNIAFDVTLNCFMNDEGIPMVNCKSSVNWKEINLKTNDFLGISFMSFPNSNIETNELQRSPEYIDESKVLSYKSFGILYHDAVPAMNSVHGINIKDNIYYSAATGRDDETEHIFDNPESAGFTYLDDYTIQAQVMTEEQFDILKSDSETFINSYGKEVTRTDSGKYTANFVSIYVFTWPEAFSVDSSAKYEEELGALYRIIL